MAQTPFNQSSKLVLGGIIVFAAIVITLLPRKQAKKPKTELISSKTDIVQRNDLEAIEVIIQEKVKKADIPSNATEITANDVTPSTTVDSARVFTTEKSTVLVERTVGNSENTNEAEGETEVCALYKSRSIDSIVSFIKNVVETPLETDDDSDIDEPISKAFDEAFFAAEAAVVDFIEKVEHAVENGIEAIKAEEDEDSEQTRVSIDSVDYSVPVGTVGFEWGMEPAPNTSEPAILNKEQPKSTPAPNISEAPTMDEEPKSDENIEQSPIEKEQLWSDEIDDIQPPKTWATLPKPSAAPITPTTPTTPPKTNAWAKKPVSPPKTWNTVPKAKPVDLSRKTSLLNVKAAEFVPNIKAQEFVPKVLYNPSTQVYESANPYQGYQTSYKGQQYPGYEYQGQSHASYQGQSHANEGYQGHYQGVEQRRLPRKRKEKVVEKVPTLFDFVNAKKKGAEVASGPKGKCIFGKGCAIQTCSLQH